MSLKDYAMTKLSAAKYLRVRDVRSSWEDSLNSDHAILILCIEKWLKKIKNQRKTANAQKVLKDMRSKCYYILPSAPQLEKLKHALGIKIVNLRKINTVTDVLTDVISSHELE